LCGLPCISFSAAARDAGHLCGRCVTSTSNITAPGVPALLHKGLNLMWGVQESMHTPPHMLLMQCSLMLPAFWLDCISSRYPTHCAPCITTLLSHFHQASCLHTPEHLNQSSLLCANSCRRDAIPASLLLLSFVQKMRICNCLSNFLRCLALC
jgi:hypothetical protein